MPLHALLIGGSDGDAARLEAGLHAAGRVATVHRARDLAEARARLAGLDSLLLLVVALEPGVAPASEWRRALEAAGRNAPLFVLLDPEQEPALTAWLGDGADDWVFRPQQAGLHAALVRVERERAMVQHRAEQQRRLREETERLVTLARSAHFHGDDLASTFKAIDEAAVRGIGLTRCGVWLLDAPRTTIRQVDLYDARTGAHSDGATLSIAENQTYFESLDTHRVLAVADVMGDPRTRDLVPGYFGPEGIGATIDVAVRLRGELVGALCLEHMGQPRAWHPDEEGFANALADLVSLALESAERHRAEAALQQAEHRARDLFTHSGDGIVLYRVEGDDVVCEDINPAAELLTGLRRATLIGKRPHEVLPLAQADGMARRWREAIKTGATVNFEHALDVPAGRRWLNTAYAPLKDQTGKVVRIAAIARDVTQAREAEALQRKLEQQVAESAKSEALARLASHIAHDVNNLLTVIVAHAQRLQELPTRSAEVAQGILQATTRGRELTQQVLTFGRRRPPERRALELAPLVRETIKLLEPTAKDVTLRSSFAARVPQVRADAGQLHQVLTNLCSNALHATRDGRGTVTLALDVVTADEAFARAHPPLRPGRWVHLAVSDTGVGMDDETARRIFEPFFSTRLDGSGTGLGLAVVQTIVEAHDGVVRVESQPGHGTTFHVYLPPLEEESVRPGSGQHLMLVDDHPGMARVSARLLETLGYQTSVFDDPREALEAFRQEPEKFDAVLTDLSMPQMSGEDFTRGLRQLRPGVPVIVSSGMASELDDAARERLGVSAVLLKPWRLEEAVRALERALR